MKIAIVVPGRFHAFDLAGALLERGHDITLFTNYPKWAVARFGISPDRVRSFWLHGIIARLVSRLRDGLGFSYPEEWVHVHFGRWAAKKIGNEKWDVVHCWSGVSEEIFDLLKDSQIVTLLMRGSAHIRIQSKILCEEETRTGSVLDRPSPWMIAREEREYAKADYVGVLSTFALESFCRAGVGRAKLCLTPLGASLGQFRPTAAALEERCQRILSGAPLRVLFVGSISFRKGFWDIRQVVERLSGHFRFRLLGPVDPEVAKYVARMDVESPGKKPQKDLPQWYAEGDVFFFPTIEDGFAVVLAQASASGLPVLTTTNSAGPDMIRDGENGWVLPIRDPNGFAARLEWCDAHRAELATMVRRIREEFRPRDWADVAADFEATCEMLVRRKARGGNIGETGGRPARGGDLSS